MITSTIHAVRRPLALLCALAMLLTSAVVVAVTTAAQANAATAEITSGTVTWGFKESWRKYIGTAGTTLSGGVTARADGAYDWPVTSGSFDDATNTVVLKLAGTLRYQEYQKPDGTHLLDSTFGDLQVEIGPQRQVVRGDYTGFRRDGGALEKLQDIDIATLDVTPGAFDRGGDTTTWTSLPATAAGDPFTLYSKGTVLDPVSISYTGPGGVPELGDRFTTQGTPVFGQDKQQRWASDRAALDSVEYSRMRTYASTKHDVVHVVGRLHDLDTYNQQTRYTLTALNSADLHEITKTVLPVPDDAKSTTTKSAFDPATDTVYVLSNVATDPQHQQLTVQASTYDAAAKSYGAGKTVGTYTSTKNLQVLGTTWNEAANRLDVVTSESGADAFDGFVLRSFTPDGAAWTDRARPITIERSGPLVDAERLYAAFGNNDITIAPSVAALADGSLVAAGGEYAGADEITRPAPALWVQAFDDSAYAAPIADTTGNYPAYDADGKLQRVNGTYQGATTAADGSVLLFSVTYPGNYKHVGIDPDTAEIKATDAVQGFDTSQYAPTAGSDPEHGFDYGLAVYAKRAAVMRAGARLGEVTWDDALVGFFGSPFTVLPGGSLVVPVADPKTILPTYQGVTGKAIGLQRLQFRGITPKVTTDPADTTVVLDRSDASKPAQLTAALDPAYGGTLQWQVKERGATTFVDVDGATGTTLDLAGTPETDGGQYRVKATNDVGIVASKAATLTVHYAPRVAQDVTSSKITAGEDGQFVVTSQSSPAPAVTWQRRVAGYWQDISPDDDNFEIGNEGPSSALTVRDTNLDQSGSLFRARLRNSVGTTYSATGTLTVTPRATIPAGGVSLQGVALDWTGSKELQSAPPFGGSNYFSAGVSDGKQATYRASSGQVSVVQVRSDGTSTPATYATRAAQTSGAVTQRVHLAGGTAAVKHDGSAVVRWTGTWSVNFYGGLVPFWFSNPTLTVAADGTGRFAADLDGYGSSMADPNARTPLDAVKNVTVATFRDVEIDPAGKVTVVPAYAGVKAEVPSSATQQNRTVAGWGAWPQPFVDFHLKTGLSSYWYSSGGAADAKKAPSPFVADFTGAKPAAPVRPASKVTVTPARAVTPYGTRPVVSVRVSAAGVTPTGTVTVTSGAFRATRTLSKGRVSVSLPGTLRPGRYRVVAAYGGGNARAASGSATYRVGKSKPTVSARIATRLKQGRTFRVPVKVVVPGNAHARFSGTVVLWDGRKAIDTTTVRGSGTIRLSKAQTRKLKPGTHRLRVTVRATAVTTSRTGAYHRVTVARR